MVLVGDYESSEGKQLLLSTLQSVDKVILADLMGELEVLINENLEINNKK